MWTLRFSVDPGVCHESPGAARGRERPADRSRVADAEQGSEMQRVGVASAMVAGPRLAIASVVAFALSELADLLVYQPLRRRGWIRAVIASNAVGASIDTILFLALAGFAIWTAVPGQLLAKAVVTAVPVAAMLAARAFATPRSGVLASSRPSGNATRPDRHNLRTPARSGPAHADEGPRS